MNNQLSNDLISIVLPVYNGEQFLSQAVESCLQQTYKSFELIIVNDSSSDTSLEIAQEYAKRDQRIIVISNKENKKLPESLNVGHRAARGIYYTWISDDNILHEDFLAKMLRGLLDSKAGIIYSDYELFNVDEDFYKIKKCEKQPNFLFSNVVGTSFLYRKEVFDSLEGYDKDKFLVEDYDFWLRAALKFRVTHCKEVLYTYRMHADSLTADIANDIDIRFKHKTALKKMYDCIGESLDWSEETSVFLVHFHRALPESISLFLNFNKNILKDISNYYRTAQLEGDHILSLHTGLFKIYDQSAKLKTTKITLQILMKRPGIFFNNYLRHGQVFKVLVVGLLKIRA